MMHHYRSWLWILLLSVVLYYIPTANSLPAIAIKDDIKYYEFNVTYTSSNPDCSNYTDPRTIMINGQMPAPTITVIKGQRVHITVRNTIPLSSKADPMVERLGGGNTNMVTVHYHGIRQFGSNQADGVPFLTQDPIPPGGHYLYDFIFDTAGTYFYHAHVGLQERSLFGAIIVHESSKSDPDVALDHLLTVEGINGSPDLTYHDERTVVLSEWFHQDRFAMESYVLGQNFTILEEADSTLVNGQTINHESTLVSSHEEPCRGYSIINVEKNKTYRIRVIGASTFRTFGFAITGHRLRIIEVDGGLVEPYEIDHLEVSAGQRYSVLVTMDQPVDDYAIGTNKLWADGVSPKTNGWAILRYQDSEHQTSDKPAMTLPHRRPILPKNRPYWIWDKLKPLGGQSDAIALRPTPDRTIILDNGDGPLTGLPGTVRYYINDITYMDPPATILSRVLDGSRRKSPLTIQDIGQKSYRGYDPYLGTYPLAHMEVVDIVIQSNRVNNQPCRSHPWHTHGHSHYLMAQGPGSYEESLRDGIRNFPNPILKDTTLIYPVGSHHSNRSQTPSSDHKGDDACGWVKIRLIADNPGIWAMHCHNAPHMLMGMMVVLEESPDMIPSFIRHL